MKTKSVVEQSLAIKWIHIATFKCDFLHFFVILLSSLAETILHLLTFYMFSNMEVNTIMTQVLFKSENCFHDKNIFLILLSLSCFGLYHHTREFPCRNKISKAQSILLTQTSPKNQYLSNYLNTFIYSCYICFNPNL